jgi:thiamine-phosphate pyrophosphorylase
MDGAEATAVATGCGLHLGAQARAPNREGVRRWSRSLHHPDEVEPTLQAGASWVFLSPIWPAGSKPGDTRPCWGPEVLQRFGGRPVVALGGLTPERAAACAGAWGVASLGGIFGAPDVAEAVGAFRAALSASAGPVARGS